MRCLMTHSSIYTFIATLFVPLLEPRLFVEPLMEDGHLD